MNRLSFYLFWFFLALLTAGCDLIVDHDKNVTVNTQVPDTPAVPAVAGTPTTSGNTPDITGNYTEGDVITPQVDGVDVASGTPLTEGDNHIPVTQTDPVGNTSTADTVDSNDNPGSTNSATLPTIEFGKEKMANPESVSSVKIDVNISQVSSQDISVRYKVAGDASKIDDYTLDDGIIIIKAGEPGGSIEITDIIDDKVIEPDENITIILLESNGATLGDKITFTYTILNDDHSNIFPNIDEANYKKSFTDSERVSILSHYESYLTSGILDDTKFNNSMGDYNLLSDLSALYLSDKNDTEVKDKLEKYGIYLAENMRFTGYGGRNEPPRLLKHFIAKALRDTQAFSAIDARLRGHFQTDRMLDGTLGVNSDTIHTASWHMLLYGMIYIQDEEKRREYFTAFKSYLENFTAHRSNGTDGIKVDGLGFHHGTFYNAYMYAITSFIRDLQYLRSTSYQIGKKAYLRLRKAIWAGRVMSNSQTIANSLSGRHPFATTVPYLGRGTIAMLLPIGEEITGKKDKPLVAYYKSLSDTSAYPDIPKETTPPQGFWQFNYGNLGIYRKDGWLAAIKGMNKFFWGSEIYATDNRYGKYQSYGAIEIIYKDGLAKSGMSAVGWDWNMPPGTTTKHLGFEELKAKGAREDAHNPLSVMATALSFGGDDSFGYGIRGDMGAYGTFINYNDFQTHKSVFAYQGKLLALGSNIFSSDTNHTVATNLFQIAIENSESCYVDDVEVSDIPYSETITSAQIITLIDPVGTGYYIKDANVTIDRKVQTSPDQSGNGNETSRAYASAFIDHGKAPTDAKYEYIIVPNTTQEKMGSIDFDYYEIVQQNAQAHIVRYKESNIYNYVLFESNLDISKGPLKYNDHPMIVILKENDGVMDLKIVNPQLFRSEDTTIALRGDWSIEDRFDSDVEIVRHDGAETMLRFQLKDGLPAKVQLTKQTTQNLENIITNLRIDGVLDANSTLRAIFDLSDSSVDTSTFRYIWQSKETPFAFDITQYSESSQEFTIPDSYELGNVYRVGAQNSDGSVAYSKWVSELPNPLDYEYREQFVRLGPATSGLGLVGHLVGISAVVPGDRNDIYALTGNTLFAYWYAPVSKVTWGIYKLSKDKSKFVKLYGDSNTMSGNSGGGEIKKLIFVRGGDVLFYGAVASHDKSVRGRWGIYPPVDENNKFANPMMLTKEMPFTDELPLELKTSEFDYFSSAPYFKMYIKKVIK